MVDHPYLFASYSRQDAEKVQAFISGLKEGGINVWSDENLRPGENWRTSIQTSLLSAAGLLVFVSNFSMKSEWVRSELAAVARDTDRHIFPVILEHVENIPTSLAVRQWIDVSKARAIDEIRQVAKAYSPQIKALLRIVPAKPPVTVEQSIAGAKEIVSELQKRPEETSTEVAPTKSVFLIHGHDEKTLEEVEVFLKSLEVEPVILKRIGGPDQSLWQKFKRWSKDIKYAVAILSPDDLGASKHEYDSEYEGQRVGARSLQYRARQNVILELGYFYGYLDWDKVFVLFKAASNPYPKFEMPSDLAGIVYDTVDEEGHWKEMLRQHLLKAGFILSR